MTFEQAVTLFELAAAEMKSQGALGFRDLSDERIEIHIGPDAVFEAIPGTAQSDCKTENYEHVRKTAGKFVYLHLYRRPEDQEAHEENDCTE